MLFDLLAADGRESASDACVEQTQIFIDFGRGTHGRARVAAVHLLFDGDGRRNPLDIVAFRFAHTAQELAGVSRKAFHIAALSLGIQRVEGQGRLARTRQSGNDNQLFARDIQINVLQIIDPGPFDMYVLLHE